jgi:hypothetical protein
VIEIDPFLSGFLEKVSFVKAVPPSLLLEQLANKDLPRYARENYSQQLRTRDWDRTLRGVAMTGGGAVLGSGLGAAAGHYLIPEHTYHSGPSWVRPEWLKLIPAGIGSAIGGTLGRQLEMALLDPQDRVYYSSPERLKGRLERENLPLLAPTEGPIPEIV